MCLLVIRKELFDIDFKDVLSEVKFILLIILYQLVIGKDTRRNKTIFLFLKFLLFLFYIVDINLGLFNL